MDEQKPRQPTALEIRSAALGIRSAIGVRSAKEGAIVRLLTSQFTLEQLAFLRQQIDATENQNLHFQNENLKSWVKGSYRRQWVDDHMVIANTVCVSAVAASCLPTLGLNPHDSKGLFIDIPALITIEKCSTCDTKHFPANKPLDETDLLRIRGELIEVVVQTKEGALQTPRCCDSEHYEWLGANLEEVRKMMPLLLERGSVTSELVRQLRSTAAPLTDGML